MSSLAMPFIDNDLLWNSDHDGKMVDLSSCLQDASVAIGQQNPATGTAANTLGELSQSDLSSLGPPLAEGQIPDTEDIFKHLSDTTAIEIENILSEFNQTTYIKQEEINNNVSTGPCDGASDYVDSKHDLSLDGSKKFTIAAANPILAEKLSTPSEQNLQALCTNGRHQAAPLTPKVEKGKNRPTFTPFRL